MRQARMSAEMYSTFQQRIFGRPVEMLYSLFGSFSMRRILRLGLAAISSIGAVQATYRKNVIIDTDFFSDVE
jgi:hypothetical protein